MIRWNSPATSADILARLEPDEDAVAAAKAAHEKVRDA